MKIDLVIFDFDGTLADSEKINNHAISNVLISLGHKDFTLDYCLDYFVGGSVYDIKKTLINLNERDIDGILDQMKQKAIYLAQECLKPMPYAHHILGKIQKPMCIASNGEREIVLKYCELTNIISHINHKKIFTREMVISPKPAPDIYLLAAEKMGNYQPEHCLVIEDSVVGVSAAKAAGMNVIGLSKKGNATSLKNAGAFICISNLKEVLSVLNLKSLDLAL